METRANYALIGLFALAVVAASFLFVYWVANPGRTSGVTTYKVVFTGSVAGLGRGSWVLFNGVRVGEVKDIELMPKDPSQVYALIDVDSQVPVRADTKARLESAGFTGVSSVALDGGSATAAPLPTPKGGGPPVLYAETSGLQDLMDNARRIAGQASGLLDKSQKLVDDADGVIKAVDPAEVKSIVKDVASLSAKLNTAADKVDAVLTSLNGTPGSGDPKGAMGDVADAAKAIRKLADDLDTSTKQLTANLNRFTTTGLRQYEALAVDGRKTLAEIDEAVRSIENNPQQFLFGKKQTIPEYRANH